MKILIRLNENFERTYSRLLISIPITFFLCFVLCIFYYLIAGSYSHELGHIGGGILSDILTGSIIHNYTISNWIISPLFLMIPFPQQTRIPDNIVNTPLLFLGGIISSILVIFFICLLIYFTSNFETKKRIWLLLPFTITIQFVNNFLCGTDNQFLKPYSICQENLLIAFIFYWSPIILFFIFSFIVFPLIFKLSLTWVDKLNKKC